MVTSAVSSSHATPNANGRECFIYMYTHTYFYSQPMSDLHNYCMIPGIARLLYDPGAVKSADL